MKKLQYTLTAVALILLLSALFFNSERNSRRLYSQTEFLMDTECTIQVYGSTKSAKDAVSAAFDEISRIEGLTSLYIDTSDVSRINNSTENTPITVDDTTFEIIKTALDVSEKSDGAFDITISPIKELWNFKSGSKLPNKDEISAFLELVNYKNIILDENSKTVTKLNSSTRIDLGGIAKGYSGDAAKRILKAYNAECGIIDLGGNITVFGDNPNSEDKKWGVGLQIPFEATGSYDKVIRAYDNSVVSSGSYERYFEYDGKIYHHILDPKTGYPSDNGFSGVSVVHKNSALADALSTACFVLGEEKGTQLAKSYGAEVYFNQK